MLMGYYNEWHSLEEIALYMEQIGNSLYYGGVGGDTIVEAARHFGFKEAKLKYGWEELKKSIASGNPCIVYLRIRAGDYPRYYLDDKPVYTNFTGGHWVVVCGLEADENGNVKYVVVNDPASGANPKNLHPCPSIQHGRDLGFW
ncbi:peptidase C39-like protein [Caldanaerobacter subterraneus]|jgi:hypothetical protein|uniref:Peptidase C39-like protein n=2 Tax=Caldanaerobacter subterraneus TaxID=911092 RepID=A0A4R2K5V5_9THEO|nr:peptidase C39-like protein [Caldanaerobacter subterraneus]